MPGLNIKSLGTLGLGVVLVMVVWSRYRFRFFPPSLLLIVTGVGGSKAGRCKDTDPLPPPSPPNAGCFGAGAWAVCSTLGLGPACANLHGAGDDGSSSKKEPL